MLAYLQKIIENPDSYTKERLIYDLEEINKIIKNKDADVGINYSGFITKDENNRLLLNQEKIIRDLPIFGGFQAIPKTRKDILTEIMAYLLKQAKGADNVQDN